MRDNLRPCKKCKEEHLEQWKECSKTKEPCYDWIEWLTSKRKEEQNE